MPWNARNELLRLAGQNNRALSQLERRAFRDLSGLYRDASEDLQAAIESRRNTLEALAASEEEIADRLARDQALLAQLRARLDELAAAAANTVQGAVEGAVDLAGAVGQEEAALIGRALGLVFHDIDFPSIEVGLPQALAELARRQQAVADLLLQELRASLIRGESFWDIMKRLLDANAGLFPRGRTSAMLAARRTVITGNNAARDALYRQMSQDVPGLGKQAVAAISPRTTDCCLRVHGQVQPLNRPYKLEGLPRFAAEMMFPAFHWNCRTSSVPYHPDFEVGAAISTADMQRAARAELTRRDSGERTVSWAWPEHATSGS